MDLGGAVFEGAAGGVGGGLGGALFDLDAGEFAQVGFGFRDLGKVEAGEGVLRGDGVAFGIDVALSRVSPRHVTAARPCRAGRTASVRARLRGLPPLDNVTLDA